MDFHEFQLHYDLLDGLDAMGFYKATPIQEQAIPVILDDKDVIAAAQTGTGKTAAYLLPILHKIANNTTPDAINTIIIAPTRELAKQIDQQVEAFAYFLGISSYPVYGGGDGMSFMQQRRALVKGADIIIATPGKLLSHLSLGYVKLKHFECLILDEADKMLDMGFQDDIMRIISFLPKKKKRQTLLFSATMPQKIKQFAKKILTEPTLISIANSKTATKAKQEAYILFNDQKERLLKHLLKNNDWKSLIVFSSTKNGVKTLYERLRRAKFAVGSIHSDLNQEEREKVLRAFKNKSLNILVATDILARGIDIDSIEVVINYDIPYDAEDYVHRIGRTARADADGLAISFVNQREQFKFGQIEKLIGNEIEKIAFSEELTKMLGETPTYQPKRRSQSKYGQKRKGNSYNKKKNYRNNKGQNNSSNSPKKTAEQGEKKSAQKPRPKNKKARPPKQQQPKNKSAHNSTDSAHTKRKPTSQKVVKKVSPKTNTSPKKEDKTTDK